MQLKEFLIKVVIVFVAAILFVMYSTYSIKKAATDFVRDEIGSVIVKQLDLSSKIDALRVSDSRRIRLLGMTTFNPAVYYKVSIIKEKEKNLPGAIEEMELGLGLLEMWPDNEKPIKTFQARLDSLKTRQ